MGVKVLGGNVKGAGFFLNNEPAVFIFQPIKTKKPAPRKLRN